MNKFILIFLLLLSAFSLFASDQWNLNDVSYLFKIPNAKTENTDAMMSPKNAGDKGELIPFSWYERIPVLYNSENGRISLYQKELKAVSVRIDPCPNTYDPKACSPEVRIVWQPIIIDQYVDVPWLAQDAALHSFYKLSNSEFALLKKDLWDLKLENKKNAIDTTKLPLGIHPALLNSIVGAKFNLKLQSIILKNCGEKNLTKVTFMSLITPNIWWRFGGVEKRNGDFVKIEIPRVGVGSQDILNTAIEENEPVYNPGTEMDATITIANDYPEVDDLMLMLNHGMRNNDKRDHDVFVQKLGAVDRFRNPHKTNPTNLDCASCHFADAAKFYAGEKFSDLKDFKSSESYKNPNPALFDLTNTSISQKGTRLTLSLIHI